MSDPRLGPGAALVMLGFLGVLVLWLLALVSAIFSKPKMGRDSMSVGERILFALSVLAIIGWVGFELLFRAISS